MQYFFLAWYQVAGMKRFGQDAIFCDVTIDQWAKVILNTHISVFDLAGNRLEDCFFVGLCPEGEEITKEDWYMFSFLVAEYHKLFL